MSFPGAAPYSGAQPLYLTASAASTSGSSLCHYDASQEPITTQPSLSSAQTSQFLIAPVAINLTGYLPGLEYLKTVKQLLVRQRVNFVEVFTGCEMNNRFNIYNELDQRVYTALEHTNCCVRNICGKRRPFDLKIFDNCGIEVIHMHRRLACSLCCFPCCLQSMLVFAPPDNFVGTIEEEWGVCEPSFRIRDHNGELVLRIEGPICTYSLCGSVNFEVVSVDDERVGQISKKWSGLARELFTDADFFGIKFPLDLDVRMKAVLLGATFLIDIMFFENSIRLTKHKNLIVPYCIIK